MAKNKETYKDQFKPWVLGAFTAFTSDPAFPFSFLQDIETSKIAAKYVDLTILSMIWGK